MSLSSVWISHPDRDGACNLVEILIAEGLAACGHVFAPGLSIYKWKGEVVRGAEVMILLKTSTECEQKLISKVKEHHPYEIPEIIFQSIDGGLPEYLDWVAESVSSSHFHPDESGET